MNINLFDQYKTNKDKIPKFHTIGITGPNNNVNAIMFKAQAYINSIYIISPFKYFDF
jgi:hypothetical protein